ncbi:ATP-binding protein [Pseudooceanicola onchidii]|uniref:ATP-binding protein n=1 Tax=Pseudooceanicola onchidii TaxID=2562279 RepID=UPI0010AA2606|nr:ATP-binding protein [Pseudooceanicola onchidii]
MRNSLGALLAIGLAGLQLIAVLAVVFSSFVTSERALLDHARALLSDIGTNAIEHSRGFLNPARGAAELSARLAEDRVVASDVPEQLERLLFQQLQIAPQFAGVYHGTEDGGFVYVMRSQEIGPFRTKIIRMDGDTRSVDLIWRDNEFNMIDRKVDPEDPYDPRTRPWYIRAREQLTTIWTDPYIFFSSQRPGITLASPVLEGPDAVRGIVGVDIEISEISDFLARLRIGASGKALIIHRNGDVIAHPDKALLKTKDADGSLRFVDVQNFDDPIVPAAFGHLLKDGMISVEKETLSQFTYSGETYVSVVMPPIDENLPWITAAYAPESDFTAVIEQNRTTNLWIAVFVAIVTGLCGLGLANYIYKPVRAFAVRSALISQGEIDPNDPQPKTYQELENANQALMQEIAARRATEIEYGQTFDLSSRGMAQIDAETGHLSRVNDRFVAITGYSAQALAGMTFSDLAHPDDPPFLAFNPGQGDDPHETTHELRCLRPDGSVIWVVVTGIMIFNAGGTPLHYVLTIEDISQARQTEDQIAHLSRDLSNLSRDKTMGQVAAGLAHELNQPLTAITQNADSALYAVDQMANADADLRATLEEIAEQSMRAGEIIKALRAFIRRDEGTRTHFDLADLVDQTKQLVIAEARSARVTITADLDRLPLVNANRLQIAQVLVNLIRNAIEALNDSPNAGRRIHISAEDTGDQIRVCVADTGPGVDPKISLFTDFESTKPAGMGLGLSICKSIVQANGGRLWHEKREPDGANFYFTIDVADA